jgi:hypothetical protein
VDNPSTYEFTDKDFDLLQVQHSRDVPGCAYIWTAEQGVVLPPSQLPKLVAGLYCAAGQRPPIVLDRPDDDEVPVTIWVDEGRVVAHHHRDQPYLTPAEARARAARYAAAADLAEAAPDREQVTAMAEAIDGITNGVGPNLGERIARELVRAGWRREAVATGE